MSEPEQKHADPMAATIAHALRAGRPARRTATAEERLAARAAGAAAALARAASGDQPAAIANATTRAVLAAVVVSEVRLSSIIDLANAAHEAALLAARAEGATPETIKTAVLAVAAAPVTL